MSMWDNDIIYGGEQLEPSVQKDGTTEYVLWDCGVVAENVTTALGEGGTKVELVISRVRLDKSDRSDMYLSDPPAKYGTFASSIVTKVRAKSDGDLPAVVVFSKVPPKDSTKQEAFVMTYKRRWEGDPATPLPPITTVAPAVTAQQRIDIESGRFYTTVGGRRVLGDQAPKALVTQARKAARDQEDAAVKDMG